MKTLKLPLFILFFAFTGIYTFGQDEGSEIKTLFKSDHGSGGYGGIVARYTEIGTTPGIVVGARGGFIAGHSLAVGLAGNLISGEKVYNERLAEDCKFSGGYGGIFIEPILLPKYPIHIAVPIVMGMGGIAYEEQNSSDVGILDSDWNGDGSRSFFIVEPGIELEINVLRFFRLAMGGYYRLTNDVNLKYNNSNDLIAKPDFLRGFSIGLTLKLGKF